MQMTPLGQIMDFQNGRAFKSSEWEETGLPIIRIQNLNNAKAPYNYFNGTFDKRILVDHGDLLFSWSGTVGTSFGPHLWDRQQALLNQHIFKVELKPSIEKRYAYYALLSITSRIENDVNGAVGLTHITKAKLVNFEIPLPSVDRQRKIIEKLDEAFAEIVLLEKKLDNLHSLFVACDTSLLNQKFFENESHRISQRRSSLGEVTEMISRGISPSYLDTAKTVVLNQRCIRDGNINFDLSRRHDEKVRKVQGIKLLRDGDGLINSTGVGTLGRTALFKNWTSGECTVDSHVTIVRPLPDVLDSDYFGLVLKSLEPVFVSYSTGTSGQTELPREAIRETAITFLTDLDAQKNFFKHYSSVNSAIVSARKLLAIRRSLFLSYANHY